MIYNILENKENIEQLEKNIEQFSNYNSTEKIVNEILKAI